jgi:arabinose-5-phosphate isomerase
MTPQEVLLKEAFVIISAAKQELRGLTDLIHAVTETARQGRYIVVTGIGKNADIAKKIASTYTAIGIPAFYLDAFESLHGDVGVLQAEQLLIGLSKSGETGELVQLFEIAAQQRVILASLTCAESSSLTKLVHAHGGHAVVLPCAMEADAHNLAPTCSSTLLLAVGDAIGVVVSERLDVTAEDFWRRHPAGALGKQLEAMLCK